MSSLIEKIRSEIEARPKVWRCIAHFVLDNEGALLDMKLRDVSEGAEVSEGSIINFVRSLGYPGFVEFKVALAQSLGAVNERYARGDLNCMSAIADSAIEALSDAASLDSELLRSVAAVLLGCEGRVCVIGIETSYHIAEILAGYLTRIGILSFASDRPYGVATALKNGDVMIAVSYSGETEEICKACHCARERGAFVTAITSFPSSRLARLSSVCLSTELNEARDGEFPLVARIVELAVIDALCSSVIALKREAG